MGDRATDGTSPPQAVTMHVWYAMPLAGATASLTARERARHDTLPRAEDRARFATGRMLAKAMAASWLAVPPADVPLMTVCRRCGGPHGKPWVEDSGLELSIAHAGDRVVVALSTGAPIGIDVEPLDTVTRVESLGPHILSGREWPVLAATPERRRPGALLRYWVRKEALLKATGDGLSVPLASITVSPPDEAARLVHWAGPGHGPGMAEMADVSVGSGYVASVVSLAAGPLRIRTVDMSASLRQTVDIG